MQLSIIKLPGLQLWVFQFLWPRVVLQLVASCGCPGRATLFVSSNCINNRLLRFYSKPTFVDEKDE